MTYMPKKLYVLYTNNQVYSTTNNNYTNYDCYIPILVLIVL